MKKDKICLEEIIQFAQYRSELWVSVAVPKKIIHTLKTKNVSFSTKKEFKKGIFFAITYFLSCLQWDKYK